MKTRTTAIISIIILLLFITATATGSGFVVPLFDSTKNFTATSLSQQPEIKTQLKPNLNTTNNQIQKYEVKAQKKEQTEKSAECTKMQENQKISALKQVEIETSCQGPISTSGCTGSNCSAFQSIACSYCSSVNPSVVHLQGCTPDSCPSGYFNQGISCGPSGACNNCDGSNCDYDCANQMLECTRTCTTNPCSNPDYPNYCDGYCWSECASIGAFGGTCCNGSWRCCSSPDTEICCPSSGDPSQCCGIEQVCLSNGNCYTPQATTELNGYLKDHYGNPLQGKTMRLTTCSDITMDSYLTQSNGYWELNADPGNYKLKTDLPWETITWIINGETCYAFGAGEYNFGDMQINIETINYGYLKDEYGNAWNNILVELTDCSDNTIISDATDSSGYFYLKTLKGNYKFKTLMPWGEMEWTINGEECPLYHWNEWNMGTLTVNSDTIVSGQIVGHENPLEGTEAILADCSGPKVNSDFTDFNGEFSVSAPKNYYKFQTGFDWGTITWNIEGKECNLYSANYIDFGMLPKIETTIHGYFFDLENNPINGLQIELYDCSDNLVDSDTTNSSGYFSITNDAKEYQLKIVIEGYRIPLTNQEGESCFVFFGDIDIGTLNINPTINCTAFNNSCYNENWRLFSCYFDSSVPSCVCYYEICEFGCTEGLETCNAGQQETIKIDVDNINDNYAPVSGAKIYLDNQFIGVTDSYGKKDVFAFPGFRAIKVFCPDNSFCSEKGIYFNSTTWEYFDCDCGTQKGNIQVNVDNINGYPVANVYVFLDEDYSKTVGLTNPFGFTYIKNLSYGNHRIDIRYKVTNPDYQGIYQITQNINLNQEEQTINFTSNTSSSNIIAGLGITGNGDFSGNIVPLVVVAMAATDIISIGLSIEDYCNCINDANNEAFGGGFQTCINSIESCVGDTRNCINTIRQEAGKTAQECWFEELMLVGDAVSPLIPVGLVGHAAVVTGKSFKKLSFVDNITKGIGKIADDLWSYTKQGTDYFTRWFDNLDLFKKSVNIGFDTTKWSNEAIQGLESFVKSSPDGQKAAKRIGKELGEEAAENAFRNLQKLREKGVEGVNKLQESILDAGKVLDNKIVIYGKNSAEAEGARGVLNGRIFEAKASAHSKFIDDVQEVSHKVKFQGNEITEFDAILNDNSILEFKSGYPNANDIKDKIKKLNRGREIENRGHIKFVFENQPSQEVINAINEAGSMFLWEVL